MVWCTQCMVFSSCTEICGDRIKTKMSAAMPYMRGFVFGYLALTWIPQPYASVLMLFVCVTLILSGLGAFK